MKYTLCITQQCNMRCKYCYIWKKDAKISASTANKIIDFMFKNNPSEEKIEFGFFGGEPLLEFDLIKQITYMIEHHSSYKKEKIVLSVVTNGTIFSDEIGAYLNKHNIGFCVSCDGPAYVQDVFRCFPDGGRSSETVNKNIQRAMKVFPTIPVNAVFHPKTIKYLPEVVDYFVSLGLKQIHLNPDFSAPWSKKEIDLLPEIFNQIANKYISYYLSGDPKFISLIDSKVALILRGGYGPLEKCRMGRGEYAFTPSGNIFPCERLIGSDEAEDKCIGNIDEGIDISRMICHLAPGESINRECISCSLKNYCMNWCGCSNYFSTGYYNRVSPFLCALERTSIEVSFNTFRKLEKKLGPKFLHHLAGMPVLNSIERELNEDRTFATRFK